MPLETVNTATFGMAPSTLMVLPIHRTMAGYQPANSGQIEFAPFLLARLTSVSFYYN